MSNTRQQTAARSDADVIVVGAGAAGLTAAAELAETGKSVLILEARDRIGGRMFTLHDPRVHFPIELGAEFIHGRPPEIFDTLQEHNIPVAEVDGDNWCVRSNRITPCDFFSEVNEILKRMDGRGPDESFQSFLDRCCPDASVETKQHAWNYVSGFNAADPALVSVHWLVQQSRAEEKIEGERAFHARNGYTSLLDILHQRAVKNNVSISTNAVVERVTWSKGNVTIAATRNDSPVSFRTPRLLLTVPLGVLQATAGTCGSIEFRPPLPPDKLKALAGLEMGKVIRIVLRFRDRFWDHIAPDKSDAKTLANMSFLFSQDDWFPTWWTMMPEQVPLITGWAPFRCAEHLAADNVPVADRALQSLSTLLKVERKKLEGLLEGAHFHNWQDDPFSRGAYSYARAGSADAPEILGRPIEDTLFFAGEATDVSGNNGTVHGAIASARRAVADITGAIVGH